MEGGLDIKHTRRFKQNSGFRERLKIISLQKQMIFPVRDPVERKKPLKVGDGRGAKERIFRSQFNPNSGQRLLVGIGNAAHQDC